MMREPVHPSSSSRQQNSKRLTVEALPAFPAIATRALRVSNDPTSCAADIERIISYDTALASRLLKVANSAYYGVRHEVKTIRQAVVLLGITTVRGLIVSVSSYDLFARAGTPAESEGLWLHSIGTAVAADRLAKRAEDLAPDEAYVAGLLHDVGVAVIAASFPDELAQIRSVSSESEISWRAAEAEVLGFDHSYAGEVAAAEWGLPGSIRSAIAYHHSPALAAAPELATCIHVADLVACRAGFAFDPMMADQEIDSDAVSVLELTQDDIDQVSEQLSTCVDQIREVAAEMVDETASTGGQRGERAA